MQLNIIRIRHANAVVVATETVDAVGPTGWVCLTGNLAVQATGAASNLSYYVERSSLDPNDPAGANPAPADQELITGSPAAGMSPVAFSEPGVGWWRIVVTNIVGGSVLFTITGFHGDGDGVLPGVPVKQ